MNKQFRNMPHKQHGFTLMEALVAFLILSIGMLGIASLQLISVKSSHTATLRTVVVIKVEEMLERIRNNPLQVVAYTSLAGDAGVDNNCDDRGGSVNICTAEDMMSDDIFNWKKELERSMLNTNVAATIDVVAPTPGVQPTAAVLITVAWQEREQWREASGESHRMKYEASTYICNNTSC